MKARVPQALLAFLVAACSATVPASPELERARSAFRRATAVPASQAPLAELEAARSTLERAEQAFVDDPGSPEARHLAYLALRQAERGEALAAARASQQEASRVEREAERLRAQLEERRRERRRALRAEQSRTEAERRRVRERARARAQRALSELARLGELSAQGDGFVLRIPEQAIYSRNRQELLRRAAPMLQQIALALRRLDRARFVVQAHGDWRGHPEKARRLTLKEADQIRAALVAAGLPPQQVLAMGKGADEPLAAEDDEGARRLNRRVEIWIEQPESLDPDDAYSGLLAH
jgi:outer membrane protein OmpA-like peptidoglycan-associated protein